VAGFVASGNSEYKVLLPAVKSGKIHPTRG